MALVVFLTKLVAQPRNTRAQQTDKVNHTQ